MNEIEQFSSSDLVSKSSCLEDISIFNFVLWYSLQGNNKRRSIMTFKEWTIKPNFQRKVDEIISG